jgi:hypothetical protein
MAATVMAARRPVSRRGASSVENAGRSRPRALGVPPFHADTKCRAPSAETPAISPEPRLKRVSGKVLEAPMHRAETRSMVGSRDFGCRTAIPSRRACESRSSVASTGSWPSGTSSIRCGWWRHEPRHESRLDIRADHRRARRWRRPQRDLRERSRAQATGSTARSTPVGGLCICWRRPVCVASSRTYTAPTPPDGPNYDPRGAERSKRGAVTFAGARHLAGDVRQP